MADAKVRCGYGHESYFAGCEECPYAGFPPPQRQAPPEATYLGDGVYAEFDGYQIWLHANEYPSACRVALEPEVFRNLLAFKARISKDGQ